MAAKGVILSFPVDGEVRCGKLIFAIGMYERHLKTLTPEFERDSRRPAAYPEVTAPVTSFLSLRLLAFLQRQRIAACQRE